MTPEAQAQRLLTTREAALYLSIPEGTLRYWRKVGVGPAWVKLEGSIRYDVADLDAYVAANRRVPSVRNPAEDQRRVGL